MNRIRRIYLAFSLVLIPIVWVGCSTTEKSFKVTSHPQGATIYVDGDPRGQTNMAMLNISFNVKPRVQIWVEKEGYQTDGKIVDLQSPEDVAFFLKEAPNNKKILETLTNIERHLERLPVDLRNILAQSSTNKGE